MTDPFQSLLLAANLPKHNLPLTSRYYYTETALMDGPDSEPIIYLRRRFVPPPGLYFSQQAHKVIQGERLDNITAQYLGDPEQFWQLADANLAMRPEELTEESGRLLKIPQGTGLTQP